ncbi:MAG: tyrosine--tRNA ligase [Patescibacteria group bacterium]|nr:tyrosine--tRNA ligase [Patescibacteria group bacterium]
MSVNTDQQKIDSLLARHVVEAIAPDSLREKLTSGRQLRIKFGADPSSPDLHLGHAVGLKKLREFQELGHQVVFLIGDYTARIGDPSGKSKTRPMLTPEEIDANAKTYFEQAGKILDVEKLEIRRNSEWFADMTFEDVIRLASNFTVARMIERDDFANRLKEGSDIRLHEIMYPMMQAYDSVVLKADIEVGASDQKFNILAGRELQKKMGLPEQDCLFIGPILVGTDGEKKMSKSLGNYVGLTDAPQDMYGKTMSIPDAALWNWFELATDLSAEEIDEMRSACERGELNPRDAKMRLAREIVAEYHGAIAAADAEENFIATFQRKETPDDVTVVEMCAGRHPLVGILVAQGLATSKGEARRLIEQGGVKVRGEVVSDIQAEIELASGEEALIQKGKRFFLKLKGQ